MIKDIPGSERPRERLLTIGAENLSIHELLAIVISTGSQNNSALETARDILSDLETIGELRDRTAEELMKTKGIGVSKATKLLAAVELGKRVLNENRETVPIRSPADVFKLLKDEIGLLKQEVLYALYLDLKSNLIAKRKIFVGGLNQSVAHPREVFRYAVKYSAYQIILAHNHPSGDPEPSANDIEMTKRFLEAGEILQIFLADHVIIGKAGYVSIVDKLKNGRIRKN